MDMNLIRQPRKPEFPAASKLPIAHPEYRYPQSKNIYCDRLQKLLGPASLDQDTETRGGEWNGWLGHQKDQPLTVEIGCNGGHVLLEWAKQNPERGYLGIDWKYKQIFRGAEKALKGGLKNIGFLRARAERLPYMFGPSEIDQLFILFPDPWPKKSDHKNRLLNLDWFREVFPLMRPGGVVELRTDHQMYFDWILEHVELASIEIPGFEVESIERDIYRDQPEARDYQIPQVTLFERLFIREGRVISQLRIKKGPLPSHNK